MGPSLQVNVRRTLHSQGSQPRSPLDCTGTDVALGPQAGMRWAEAPTHKRITEG